MHHILEAMNHILEDTLAKIICLLAVVVWTAIFVRIGEWIAWRWFRGIKITGKWEGKGDDEGNVYDFKAYLFLERSEYDKGAREVNGFIVWELIKKNPVFARPIGSKGYEIVQGKLSGGKGDNKWTSLNLRHLGDTDHVLIGSQTYDLRLTERRTAFYLTKQTSCEGTTTNNKGQENGALEGSVKGRF